MEKIVVVGGTGLIGSKLSARLASGRPFSIVRATQFFEFLLDIADSAAQHGIVRDWIRDAA